MRIAEPVETGWATMWILALVVEVVLCLAIAGGIRRDHRAQEEGVRDAEQVRRLIEEVNAHPERIRYLCISRVCNENPRAPAAM